MIKRTFTIAEIKRFPALAQCPKTVTGEHQWEKDPTKFTETKKWWEMMPRFHWSHFMFRCFECNLLDDRKEYPYEHRA